MMKGKKGIEITTSTLIIFILAVIALIAIAAFFMGGFGKIADTIKGYFYGSTVGITRESAVQFCEQYCDRAQSLPKDAQPESAFCTALFDIDSNGDGKVDKQLYCKIKPSNAAEKSESLNTDCSASCQ